MDSLLVINMLEKTGLDNNEATKMFGISSGAVHTLVNLPAVLAAGIAVAIVPAVSGLMKQNKVDELRKKMGLAIRITIMISIFFTIFYFAFAESLIDLLYHGAFKGNPEHLEIAGNLLKIESLLIFLMGTSAVFTAMLQGIDKAKFPLIALLVGGGAKIAFQFSTIGKFGIYAISIGNVLCFAIAAAITCFFALYFIKIKRGSGMDWPRLSALAFLFLLFTLLLADKMPDNRWWVLLFGAISFFIYAFLVAILGLICLNKNNIGKNPNRTQKEQK
jgi:stage V sporulation protein B